MIIDKISLRDAISFPLESSLESDDNVLFWTPNVIIDDDRQSINERCKFAKQISTLCDFPDNKQVNRIKRQLNACIRAGIEIDDLTQDALASDANFLAGLNVCKGNVTYKAVADDLDLEFVDPSKAIN